MAYAPQKAKGLSKYINKSVSPVSPVSQSVSQSTSKLLCVDHLNLIFFNPRCTVFFLCIACLTITYMGFFRKDS